MDICGVVSRLPIRFVGCTLLLVPLLDFVLGCLNFVIVVNIVEGFPVLVFGVILWLDINVVIKSSVELSVSVLLFMFMEKSVTVSTSVDCSVLPTEDTLKMSVFSFVENSVTVSTLTSVVSNVVSIEDGIAKFVVGASVKNFGGVLEEEFSVLLSVQFSEDPFIFKFLTAERGPTVWHIFPGCGTVVVNKRVQSVVDSVDPVFRIGQGDIPGGQNTLQSFSSK